MTLAFILSTITRKIQDTSYSDDDIIEIINQGIGEIASVEVLPDLVTYDTVTVDEDDDFADLPTDYYAKLFHAYNTTKKQKVVVHKKVTEFLEKFPDRTLSGNVTDIVVSGRQILVREIPTIDQILQVWYNKEPELIEDTSSDLPLYLPKYLQAPLFINYACRYIYSEIEDGTSKHNPNFIKYDRLYMEARAALRTYLGVPEGVPDFVIEGGAVDEGDV